MLGSSREICVLVCMMVGQRVIMHRAVDLYCGIGGWTVGAERAGFEVVLGVDGSYDVISLFKTNFSETEAVCMKLPNSDLSAKIPLDTRFIMASPPCTLLSRARTETTKGETTKAIELVEWTIDLLAELQRRPGQAPFLWILENVAHRELQLLLDRKKSGLIYRSRSWIWDWSHPCHKSAVA